MGILWLVLRRHAAAQFGYLLFLLVLLKLAVPGHISIPNLIVNLLPQETADQGAPSTGFGGWWLFGGLEGGDQVSNTDESSSPISESAASTTPTSLSILTVLMLGWAVVVSALLAKFTYTGWKTRRLVKETDAVDPATLPIDFERLKAAARVKRTIRVATGPWVTTPVVWGVFHPVLLIPSGLSAQFTNAQIKWILLHELAHIHRWDTLVMVLQKLAQIVFFFHPGVWLANWIIDQQREYACDDLALAGSKAPRRDCGQGFLGVVIAANGLPTFVHASLGMVNHKTLIKRRLTRILDNSRVLYEGLSLWACVSLMCVALVVLPLGTSIAAAQTLQWTKVSTEGPSPRIASRMAFDSARGKAVMFGGHEDSAGLVHAPNHTWEWDGAKWNQAATTGPTARAWHSMVYDSARKKVVLFGGWTPRRGTIFGETWEWDGAEWTQVATTGPEPRGLCGMAYDSARGKVVLFGGIDSGPAFGDTWEWDGAEWTRVAAEGVETPAARVVTTMVYDSVRGRVVLYGGHIGPSQPDIPGFEDTWEWDGTRWTEIPTSNGPGPHILGMMAFDTARAKTVLFGGADEWITFDSGRILADTWEWDGSEWSEIPTPGPGIVASSMVYDSIRETFVLFGGGMGQEVPIIENGPSGDTWVLGIASSGIPWNSWSRY